MLQLRYLTLQDERAFHDFIVLVHYFLQLFQPVGDHGGAFAVGKIDSDQG